MKLISAQLAALNLLLVFQTHTIAALIGGAPFHPENSPREIGRRAAAWSLTNQMGNLSYQNVCTAYGVLKLAGAAGDEKLRTAIETAFKPYLKDRANPNRDNATVPQHQWFGFIPLELYRQTKDTSYLHRGIELCEHQYARADTNGMPGYTHRWYVDDIYGATTMQALGYACTGEEKYLDRAVSQVLTYADKLQQPAGLFHHGPESNYYWGRGNGWCAAAFAELLNVMPPAHRSREAVLAAYRRMMEALLTHQTPEGAWRQLVDDPTSWTETSCTGMFLFALSEGIQNGWLPKNRYRPVVEKAWLALASYVDKEGRLREVCVGTGLGKTLEHYLNRPRQTGDAHGQAGLLWAVASLVELVSAAEPNLDSAEEKLQPINSIRTGSNREFIVNDQPFLPIMSWAQSPKNYARLAALGLNTHAGGNADAKAAKAVGGYAVRPFDPQVTAHPYLLGWLHGDEPDLRDKAGQPRRTPAEVLAHYQKIKAAGTRHPVFMTLTSQFMQESTPDDSVTRTKLYSEYIRASDVVGFDIYPIYGSATPGKLPYVAEGATQLRALAGPRPLYAWIETHKGSRWVTYERQLDVEPMHTRCEVWMAIIRGATAIGYFTHAWRPQFTEFAPTSGMQTELKRINEQLSKLAPAILAGSARPKIEMKLAGGLPCHSKATELDGAIYIFAQNIDIGPNVAKPPKQFALIAPRSGQATITVQGLEPGTVIDVVDEKRIIRAEAGQFADQFGPLAEHIYRFVMKSTPGR